MYNTMKRKLEQGLKEEINALIKGLFHDLGETGILISAITWLEQRGRIKR